MSDEGRAKEIGETAEEKAQQGFGRIITIILLVLVGIPASIIYWIMSIIFWIGSWVVAWVGFIILFLVTWIVSLFRPMPAEWGYRHVEQEDWFLSKEELEEKRSR